MGSSLAQVLEILKWISVVCLGLTLLGLIASAVLHVGKRYGWFGTSSEDNDHLADGGETSTSTNVVVAGPAYYSSTGGQAGNIATEPESQPPTNTYYGVPTSASGASGSGTGLPPGAGVKASTGVH